MNRAYPRMPVTSSDATCTGFQQGQGVGAVSDRHPQAAGFSSGPSSPCAETVNELQALAQTARARTYTHSRRLMVIEISRGPGGQRKGRE